MRGVWASSWRAGTGRTTRQARMGWAGERKVARGAPSTARKKRSRREGKGGERGSDDGPAECTHRAPRNHARSAPDSRSRRAHWSAGAVPVSSPVARRYPSPGFPRGASGLSVPAPSARVCGLQRPRRRMTSRERCVELWPRPGVSLRHNRGLEGTAARGGGTRTWMARCSADQEVHRASGLKTQALGRATRPLRQAWSHTSNLDGRVLVPARAPLRLGASGPRN